MTQKVLDDIKIEDIESDSNIEEMVRETGLDKNIIESTLKTQKADQKYEEYKLKEQDNTYKNNSKKTKLKNFFLFIGKSFIRTAKVSKTATVTGLELTENDNIELKLRSYCHLIQNEREENKNETVEMKKSLDIKEDIDKIDYILDYSNSDKPSEMLNKDIPIRWYYNNERKFHIMEPSKTINSKINTLTSKFLFKTNSIERISYSFDDFKGDFFINRNAFLSTSLLFSLMYGFSSIFLPQFEFVIMGLIAMTMVFLSFYIAIVARSLFIGFIDYISNKPNERYYIKNIINN